MGYATDKIRNIALIGHGSNGKTSFVESMLYVTGALDRMGKVTDGNTVCDYDAEEVKRQISISMALAPVEYNGTKINVIDTPGYFDFAGEVVSAVRVADTGVIVCSAKDGLSVGAERSWKYLNKANIPVMFYISKIDEENGDFNGVVEALQDKYGSIVCAVAAPMSDGSGVIDIVHNVAYQTKGNKTTKVPVPDADKAIVESLREVLTETAAGASEELMEKYFDTMELSDDEIIEGIKLGMKDRSVVPVFCGSAVSCTGTELFLQSVIDYVPNPAEMPAVKTEDGELAIDPNGPTCAFVFKTMSDQFGKYSYMKIYSGKSLLICL